MLLQFNCQSVLRMTFVGIIDLIERVAYMYKDDLGKDPEKVEIPAEYKEQVEELRCRTDRESC